MLSWVGGKTDVVKYARAERVAGDSKFNGWKLWNLALEGITSFSTFPLRIWTYIGLAVAGVAFLYGAWMIFDTLAFGNVGVLGEYIGRIYIETKARPKYIIKKVGQIK